MRPTPNDAVKTVLKEKLLEIETAFHSDVFTYFGEINDGYETQVRDVIEDLASDTAKREKLLVILTTPGGSALAVERYTNILRHHYSDISFLVPDYAYSAGTIFCMSGDTIYMDYQSVLGPIDPQVKNSAGKMVAAAAYLDKVNELLERAKQPDFTQAEFLILKDMDLAELRGYEQAMNLTVDLLKKWLVTYKFKNWNTHQTSTQKLGQPVTLREKENRAIEIARALGNTERWKFHGRPINMYTLIHEVKLKIDDFGSNADNAKLVKDYYAMLLGYVTNIQIPIFVHTRNFI